MNNICTELSVILAYYRKELIKNQSKILDCQKNLFLCMLANPNLNCIQWRDAVKQSVTERENNYKYYKAYIDKFKKECLKLKDTNNLPEECKEMAKEYNALTSSYEMLQKDYLLLDNSCTALGKQVSESRYELYRCITKNYRTRPYLYFVKSGDTLSGIARHFKITVKHILDANVICDPNIIQIGLPLIIPVPGLPMPKAGGNPYYVVRPGDTIDCIANQLNTTPDVLAEANQIKNNIIYSDSELLIVNEINDPEVLYKLWTPPYERKQQNRANVDEQLHDLQYNTTFRWAALGEKAVPYLLRLLYSSSAPIRYFTLMSLGRIACSQKEAISEISQKMEDWNPEVAKMAELVLRRTYGVQKAGKRLHVLINTSRVYTMPDLKTNSITYPEGMEFIVLRWHNPSPAIEIEPMSKEILMYDQIKVLSNGQTGFLPRNSFNEVTFI